MSDLVLVPAHVRDVPITPEEIMKALTSLIGSIILLAPLGPSVEAAPLQHSVATSIAALSVGAVSAGRRRATQATYDTSVGNGVDINGRASLPLRSGAKRFYVNGSTGSDSNSCTAAQSASTPKATPKSAILCVTDGEGDQVLIAKGQTYSTGLYNIGAYGGFSAVYPFVIESYDPADPTNEAKLGATTSADRPVITTPGTDFAGGLLVSGTGKSYRAIRGLKFDGGGVAGVQMLIGVSAGSGNNYTLFENDDFASVQLSIQGSNTAYPTPNVGFIVRSSSFHGAWATDGHGQGLYMDSVDGATIEDNAFIHAGWKDGAAKTDAASIGGPSMFGHPIYSQVTSLNVILRRNYFGQSPDDSGELKSGGIYQRNLAIGNPIGGWFGDGDQYSVYKPFGIYADGGYNAIIGGGWCYETKDVNTVGLIHHNVCGQSDPTLGTAYGLMADDTADLTPQAISLPTYPTFEHNILFSWGTSGNDQVIHTSSSGGLIGDIHTTLTNNLWGNATSGSNSNNTGAAWGNPYTAATLATALGYPDLATAEAAWKADPQLHGWRRGVNLVMAGYGAGANLVDPSPVNLTTNMAVTLGNAASGQFIGTHDGSAFSFASLPTGVTANGLCRCWHYDGTGTVGSGTFTVTEAPPAGPPHVTTLPWSISAAPVLSSLTLTPGSTTATATVSSNTGSGKLFYGRSTASGSPTWAQIRAGYNADNTSGPVVSSQTVTATGTQPTINLSGLTASTTYYFSVAQLDGNNNPSLTSTASFTTTAGGGAATLSSPTASGTSATTASLGVTTDTGSGTWYNVVSTSSTTPSAAQIEAGNDSTGSAAAAHGSQAVSAPGVQSTSASGLTASTTYYAYYVQHTTVDSNVVGSASFTTGSSWTPASFGSSLVADLTKLDSSHLFQDTGCSTPVTTDLQTAKCIVDASSAALHFTNSTGWVYHANSGKPYLQADGTSTFTGPSVTYADANGLWAGWVTANLSNAGSDLADIGSNRILYAVPTVPNCVAYARDSGGTQLGQDNLSTCPSATDAVFSFVMPGSAGSGTVESFVNNAGNGSTAWTGTPGATGAISLDHATSGALKFYGAFFAKGDQTANKANAQSYAAALHP